MYHSHYLVEATKPLRSARLPQEQPPLAQGQVDTPPQEALSPYASKHEADC